MIAAGRRVNGEFYVAPVYNELIADGGRIGVVDVDADGPAMYGLGTPEDLRRFLADPPARFVRRDRRDRRAGASAA
jgi:hypothetical protein